MSREELNRLIADDAYAASFQTMGQYRIALLKATDSAQDVARAPEQDFGSTIDRTLPAGIIPQQAPAPAEQHPLQCPHGGQCGVGGYCDDCPARSEQAEQQGDGGALTLEQYAEQNMLTLEEAADRWKPPEQPTARDYLDTLTAVLNAIGYTEEFAASHPDLKVSEGVKLFLALQRGAIECQAHIGPDCTECGGTGFWGDSTPATQSYAKPSSAAEGPNER